MFVLEWLCLLVVLAGGVCQCLRSGDVRMRVCWCLLLVLAGLRSCVPDSGAFLVLFLMVFLVITVCFMFDYIPEKP